MATGGDNDITMSEEEMGSVLDGREENGHGMVRARSATPPPAPKKPPPPRIPARRAPVQTRTLAALAPAPTLAPATLAPATLPPARPPRSPPAPLPPPPEKKFRGGGAGGGAAAGRGGDWPGRGRGRGRAGVGRPGHADTAGLKVIVSMIIILINYPIPSLPVKHQECNHLHGKRGLIIMNMQDFIYSLAAG